MATPSRYSEPIGVSRERENNSEDEIDAAIARKRLTEIEHDPDQLVRGKELEEELADILSE